MNYDEMRLHDPGGELAIAFDALKLLEKVTHPIRKVTFLMIADEAGVATAWRLETSLQNAIDANLTPKFLMVAMSGEGINANDMFQVGGMLAKLEAPLTADDRVAINGMGAIDVKIFPRLTMGQLERARAGVV